VSATEPGPGTGSWEEYLAAARQLDAARRGAVTAAGEQAQVVQTAREELTVMRARLAPQQSRLRSLGIPEAQLQPSAAEVATAARTMAAGPEAVLAALGAARVTADAADAAVLGVAAGGGRGPGGPDGRPWLRNLLVYGPYALVVFAVQVVLYLTANAVLPALLWGLAMPVAAFGLGWVTVGLVFPAAPSDRVDRTPVVGAVVCLAVPVMLTCVGAVALRF